MLKVKITATVKVYVRAGTKVTLKIYVKAKVKITVKVMVKAEDGVTIQGWNLVFGKGCKGQG